MRSNKCKKIIMLHGDGQYSPKLLLEFVPYLFDYYSIVYGYRSKKIYSYEEETPQATYFIIKILNGLISI